MSSKRHLRRKECGTKLQFATEEQAKGFMISRRIKNQTHYRCKWCGHFHIGHPPARVRNIIRQQREARS